MKPVVLVGLPGAGKTTIGKALSRSLQCKFQDTDVLLERRFDASIRSMFESHGEEQFRAWEEQLLAELLTGGNDVVVATGGGVIKAAANRELIARRGIAVYIRAEPAQLVHRLRHDTKRPLLLVEDRREALSRLHAEREPLYREVAVVTVDAFVMPVAKLVEHLTAQLEPLLNGAAIENEGRDAALGGSAVGGRP